jgi:hypothetical protein
VKNEVRFGVIVLEDKHFNFSSAHMLKDTLMSIEGNPR